MRTSALLSPPQAAWPGPVVPPLPAVPAESVDEQEEEEEEEWSESYQPLAVEQAHLVTLGAAPGPARGPSRQPSYERVSAARPARALLCPSSSELPAGSLHTSAERRRIRCGNALFSMSSSGTFSVLLPCT